MTGRGAARGQGGFSAVEALAALAVLAVALLPLLDLQARSARAAIRAQAVSAGLAAEQSALGYIEVLNPMRDPEGVFPLGEATLTWRAVPVSEERPAYDGAGQPGRFAMRLYEVQYEVTGPGYASGPRRVLRAGWRATAPVLGPGGP